MLVKQQDIEDYVITDVTYFKKIALRLRPEKNSLILSVIIFTGGMELLAVVFLVDIKCTLFHA